MITIKELKKKLTTRSRLIGLDLGSKRIGIGICDENHKIATPFKTVIKINLDDFITDQLDWLRNLIIKADKYSSKIKKFGVFGTSISAMWIYGKIGKNINFFVDEDPTKVGKNIDDIIILHPNDVPNNSQILVPLSHVIRSKIIKRLSSEGSIYF